MSTPQRRVGDLSDSFSTEVGTRQLANYTIFDTSKSLQQKQSDTRGLKLYLPYGGNPVVLDTQERIEIGRKDPFGTFTPAVDLTSSHGANLGVSRHHADIIYMNNGYYIKDMGSTNGTWVNGQKLAPHQVMPIRYGDSLRLGHLVIAIG